MPDNNLRIRLFNNVNNVVCVCDDVTVTKKELEVVFIQR